MSQSSQEVRLEFFGLTPDARGAFVALAADIDRALDSFHDRVSHAPQVDCFFHPHSMRLQARQKHAAAKLQTWIRKAGDVSGTVKTLANALREEMDDLNARLGDCLRLARAG